MEKEKKNREKVERKREKGDETNGLKRRCVERKERGEEM
jgi:hypothetical protein